jgi:hypothetical protein
MTFTGLEHGPARPWKGAKEGRTAAPLMALHAAGKR